METERIALSQRERDRLKVLHEVQQKQLTQVAAAERLEQKILARLRQRYADFGPTLAAEHLAQEGFPVSRETLRKWMTKAALWRPPLRSALVPD
jgi:response regulator of citrate/malate metabolism